ncbi:hypothetical protein K439DRAFT_1264198, partial [Ramaria rubella]
GSSLQWTNRQLLLGGRILRTRCAPNTWNAFVRKEMEEVNKGMYLAEGACHKLSEFLSANLNKLQDKYSTLTGEERTALQEEILTLCTERQTIQRTNPKAMQRDVNATFAAMSKE